MKDSEITALAKGMVPFVREIIAEAVAPLITRLAELEARPAMKYEGTWVPEKIYSVGDFVTDDGSLWHGQDTNKDVRPGSSETWKLAVKRGRDAKGSR